MKKNISSVHWQIMNKCIGQYSAGPRTKQILMCLSFMSEAFYCSKSIIKTLEKGVKYVQSYNKNIKNLLTLF